MKKVNDEFEPLTVVNKNPEEDIVSSLRASGDSLQETLRLKLRTRNCQIRSLRAWQIQSWSGQLHETEGKT